MFQLRPYQAEAKQAILAAWDEGYRKTLLVLPTGCGKTVVFSSVTEDQVKKNTPLDTTGMWTGTKRLKNATMPLQHSARRSCQRRRP